MHCSRGEAKNLEGGGGGRSKNLEGGGGEAGKFGGEAPPPLRLTLPKL